MPSTTARAHDCRGGFEHFGHTGSTLWSLVSDNDDGLLALLDLTVLECGQGVGQAFDQVQGEVQPVPGRDTGYAQGDGEFIGGVVVKLPIGLAAQLRQFHHGFQLLGLGVGDNAFPVLRLGYDCLPLEHASIVRHLFGGSQVLAYRPD